MEPGWLAPSEQFETMSQECEAITPFSLWVEAGGWVPFGPRFPPGEGWDAWEGRARLQPNTPFAMMGSGVRNPSCGTSKIELNSRPGVCVRDLLLE